MKKVSLAALIGAACLVAASAVPAAAREHEDRGEHRGWARPYPVYVAPYYAPAPIYVAPAPVYVAPPPPVYVAPVPSSLNVVVPLRFR